VNILTKNHKAGFTLLEILLVVGIISILAGIVIVAINPSRQLAQVRNTERQSDLKQIYSALNQYYIDYSTYPATVPTTLTEICNTGNATSTHGIECGDLIDLSILVPTYLVSIPKDPQVSPLSLIPQAHANTNGTGYHIMLNPARKVVLVGARAERGALVAIGTSTRLVIETPAWACGDVLIDTRDSKSYATVLIGTQCWMQENINVGTMVTGTTTQANDSFIEKYCYNNTESNCTTYGGLYQWDEAMQYVTTAGAQGICPTGWHIPTDTEYKTLEMYLGMTQEQADATGLRGTTEGDKLKNTGLCGGRTPCGTSNFKALLAGLRSAGSFSDINSTTFFWSSNQSDTSAWRRVVLLGHPTIQRIIDTKQQGFSIRCLKN